MGTTPRLTPVPQLVRPPLASSGASALVSLAPNQLPPPQHSLLPHGLSRLFPDALVPTCPSVCVSACLSVCPPLCFLLPFPVGLTPDVLGSPGKKLCFWHSPPPTPAPEPTPTQLLLVPGNKQCEVSPPRIWKRVHPPKSPRGVGGQQPCSAVATGGRPAGAVRAQALGQAGRQPGQGTQTQRVHSFGQCCNSEQMPPGLLAQPALDRGARQWRLWSASCVPWSRNRTSMILSLLWLFYFYFWSHQVACGILFPNQGLNQCPHPHPQGKHRVLTSAPMGKSGNMSDLPGQGGGAPGPRPQVCRF